MHRKILLSLMVLIGLAGAYDMQSSRMLMERNLYYLSKGKIGHCKYWSLFMGLHECKLRRKFPGQDTIEVNANVNFHFTSSGYVDGSGVCTDDGKKVRCLTGFHLAKGDSSFSVEVDSIVYAFDYCDKALLTTGQKGNLRIDAEGTLLRPKRLLLQIFHMVDYYGEKVLRPKTEVNVSAISWTKAGIRKALTAEQRLKAAAK